jgi:hypothetical protein
LNQSDLDKMLTPGQRAFAIMCMKKNWLGDIQGMRMKMEVIESKRFRLNVGTGDRETGDPPLFR